SILRLLNNGNVGIGTTNPVARLEVRTGNPYGFRQIMDISDSFSTSIGIQNDINNDADFGGIFGYLSRITSNTTSSIFGSIIQISGEGENSRFGQIIRVNSNTTGEEGLIRGLQIELGGSISEQPKYGIYVSGSDRNYFSGDLGVRTVHPSFTLDVNGTAGVTGGVWSGSDKRWKQNIEKIEAPLNKIKRLNGKTYDWRNDEFPEKEFSMDRQIGFLAQEVQEIFPELVKENNEGYLAINYIGIIPVLVEALKEQQEAIETLQEEMEELRGKTNSTPSKSRDYSSSTIDETSIPAELFQNIPNPFIGETEISFFLPQEVGTAEIILYNLQGTQIRSN
ncbi:MAG: tail fiber domain-containing protein, partial [Bacteroidota bacterium]